MEIDLMREPKLKEHAVKYMRQGQDMNNPFDQTYRLPTPCPFLEGDLCSIYKSRPNLCVSYNEECLKRQGEEWKDFYYQIMEH